MYIRDLSNECITSCQELQSEQYREVAMILQVAEII
jgi:hypothetical protein